MPKAKQLPSGSWRCRVYVPKTATSPACYKSITAPTRKQAEMEAALFDLQKKEPEPEITLGQAMDRYIEAKSSILSPATIRSYQSLRNNAYGPIINLRLSALTQERQQSALNMYAAGSKPKTVRNASGLLYSTMQMFRSSQAFSLTLPQPQKPKIIIPTRAQLEKVIEAIRGTWLFLAILLAAALGLRRSEVCALKKTDFDFEAGTVHIQRAIVRGPDNRWVEKPPKTTKSERVLKVPAMILDHVKPYPDTDEYLIKKKPDSITSAFKRVLEAQGFKFRYHDLRHYYASILLAIGVPDQYSMQRMGHSTTHMLKNVYQHVIDEKDAEVDAVIELTMNELF